MNLAEIAAGAAAPVAFGAIAASAPLAIEVQSKLGEAGLLDSPADGVFGAVSHWALAEFVSQAGFGSQVLDTKAAAALLAAQEPAILSANDFAGRIAAYMRAKRYWISFAGPNIVYVEGVEPDGTVNDNAPNRFNDVRIVLWIREGQAVIDAVWDATTEPGAYYTQHPLSPGGAARIAFGQYKSWCVGMHGTGGFRHESLVQSAPILVYRDLNRDYKRDGDKTDFGVFGVDQHMAFGLPPDNIGLASAGCLVGRTKTGHLAFMKTAKADPRYTASNGYRFLTTIINGRDLPSE